MTTTVLVTTVSTPNLDNATSVQRILEHLEQTDEELRTELAALDQEVHVTTTLLNIADIFEKVQNFEKVEGLTPPIIEKPVTGQNGLRAHNGNGHTAVYSNGTGGNKHEAVSALSEGKAAVAEAMSLDKLLEQIQQGKLELYLHVAPEPKPEEVQSVAEEEIGQHFRENPFLY